MLELRTEGARAVILPEYGGRLHQLYVEVDGHEEPLLHSPEDIAQYAERPTRGGSFPMAPWPNRVREGRFRWQDREFAVPLDGKPHANHGRVHTKTWNVVSAAADCCEITCAFDDGWPWRGSAVQRFTLSPGELVMELEVHSNDEPFPAGCGWHPWFRRDVAGDEGVRLLVPAGRRYVIEDNLPTGERVSLEDDHDLREGPVLGERRIDDCYTGLVAPVRIDWRRLRLTMTVECPEAHVQVYTPPEALCVEPQTCSPDAFNLAARRVSGTGVAVARPGEPVRLGSRWAWRIR